MILLINVCLKKSIVSNDSKCNITMYLYTLHEPYKYVEVTSLINTYHQHH